MSIELNQLEVKFFTMLKTCTSCRVAIKIVKELQERHNLEIVHQDLLCMNEEEANKTRVIWGTPWPIRHTPDLWGTIDELQAKYGMLSTPVIIIHNKLIPLQGFKFHDESNLKHEIEKGLGTNA